MNLVIHDLSPAEWDRISADDVAAADETVNFFSVYQEFFGESGDVFAQSRPENRK